MSPGQLPEIVPGLDMTDSNLRFKNMRNSLVFDEREPSFENSLVFFLFYMPIVFVPAWFYRFTLKSTWWFWWPLAFLGGDLRQARNPKLFQWKIIGSLWARASIMLSGASLLSFATVNLVLNGTIFKHNPLLTPLGYLLVVDWKPQLWQIGALASSALSLALVFLLNDASGEYRIARESNDRALLTAAEQKFGWLERLSRVRLLFVLLFWQWSARKLSST
jgi:hypothetical protein